MLAPFYFDVTDQETGQQINVVFPFFVRIANRYSSYSWTFPNQFYSESRQNGVRSYRWDNFPFVQYEVPRRGDVAWSVLYGLVGYRRSGSYEEHQLLWFTYGRSGSSSAPPASHARRDRNGDTLLNM